MRNAIKKNYYLILFWAVFLFSFFYSPIVVNAETATTTASSTPLLIDIGATSTSKLQTQQATSTPALPTLAESEVRVREYFIDDPIMIKIAKCESSFRQFNNDGTVLLGHGLYVGVFQIDPKIHGDFAKSMGMDIFTLDGNLAYAKYLKSRSGANPWPACSRSAINLTLNLKLGMTHDQVKTVQQILNNAGFTISKSGPGSPQNETNYFGSLTRAALKRFQCDKGIVCQGLENTTGYGLVGPKTRAALIKAALSN